MATIFIPENKLEEQINYLAVNKAVFCNEIYNLKEQYLDESNYCYEDIPLFEDNINEVIKLKEQIKYLEVNKNLLCDEIYNLKENYLDESTYKYKYCSEDEPQLEDEPHLEDEKVIKLKKQIKYLEINNALLYDEKCNLKDKYSDEYNDKSKDDSKDYINRNISLIYEKFKQVEPYFKTNYLVKKLINAEPEEWKPKWKTIKHKFIKKEQEIITKVMRRRARSCLYSKRFRNHYKSHETSRSGVYI